MKTEILSKKDIEELLCLSGNLTNINYDTNTNEVIIQYEPHNPKKSKRLRIYEATQTLHKIIDKILYKKSDS
jgi:hypothetical protein